MSTSANERYVQRAQVSDLHAFQRGVTRLPAVMRQFGFKTMRRGQELVVYALLSGHDLLAVLPTSMGKTFCFQAATLALEWKTLVFSPLVALIRDQVQQAVQRGLRVASITSHNTPAVNQMAVQAWVQGNLDFLYVAPERLRHEAFIEAMRFQKPDMIAVDECHTLSAWSDTFRSAYLQIGDFITEHRPKVVSAFTATCPPAVERDVRRVLCLDQARKVIYYPRRENLDLRSLPYTGISGMVTLLERAPGAAVVYCATRKATEQMAKDIQDTLAKPASVAFYHGGMTSPSRSATQDAFARGDIDIICATNAFGMGVDKSNVRLVLHRDIASSMEGQSQEDGRAGRDGEYAQCMTFFDQASVRTHNFMNMTSCPLFKEVQRVYDVMLSARDGTGLVNMTAEEIASACKLHSKSMAPILQILSGALVIERSKALDKKWGFRVENRVDDPSFGNFLDALAAEGEEDPDGLTYIKMDDLINITGLSDSVLKNRFKKWHTSGLITYEAPSRSAPIRLVGNINQVDAERVNALRKIADAKLEQSIVYAQQIPDKDKHDYVEEVMNTKGWDKL